MSLVRASKSAATRVGQGELPPVPRRFGKYDVLFELGHGGMATVYLAVTESAAGVRKLVALKALRPEFASEAEASAMFLDEARLAVQLNHGNVVQTYEVGKADGRDIIVMEYLEGQSLARTLKRAQSSGQPLPLGLHLRLLMHVLEGLHCTHELRGYDGAPLHPVHRDVSPQNVIITYDGRAKVVDFGIAKAGSSTTHTAAGLIKGKIAYMPPEQMAGEAVDRRADVYAVGCMLWAAATGRKLWSDLKDVNIMHEVITDAIPTPRSRNPSCDPELERIVMKALARVESRYSSALELHDDLERYCEAQGIPDRPRELGRFISELFAEDRAELRARIENELSRLESDVALESAASLPPVESALELDSAQLASSLPSTPVTTIIALPSKTAGKWRWLALAAPVAAVVIYFAFSKRHQPPPVVAPVVAASAPQAPSSEPEHIKLELRSRPAAAQLFLDERPVAGNPALEIVAKDGGVHRLRAELAGYRTASAELVSSADQTVDLNLEPIAPEQTSAQHAATSRPVQKKAPPSAQSAPSKSANCAQPFYVGADGIKRIKPACL